MAPSASERLSAAAFALFEERGFEETTVDDIAARAGVGRTTFFRSFRSKEDVIFPDHDALLDQVRARLAASTPDTARIAISEAARIVLRHYLDEGDLARARYRLTSRVPALHDREVASVQAYQRVFRHHLRDQLGSAGVEARAADLESDLLAALVVTAHNNVLRRWLRDDSSDPEADLERAVRTALAVLDGPREGSAPSAVVVLRADASLRDVLPAIEAAVDAEGGPSKRQAARRGRPGGRRSS